MKAGRFRHRPADIDEWGPVMDAHGATEHVISTLERVIAQQDAELTRTRAERDSAVRGTADAVRTLVARLGELEALCSAPVDGETRSHVPVADVLAVIRGQVAP